MKKRMIGLFSIGVVTVMAGCSEGQNATASMGNPELSVANAQPAVERWYSREQVAIGNELFQSNCASCHKPDASGSPTWKTMDEQGKLPPPPLNGTAHTWHHPLSVLRRTVQRGGVPLGGSMPGFADKLSSSEIDATLAWVQTHWPDEIYAAWHKRNREASRPLQPYKKN